MNNGIKKKVVEPKKIETEKTVTVLEDVKLKFSLKFEDHVKKNTMIKGIPIHLFHRTENLSGQPAFVQVGGDYRNNAKRPSSFSVTAYHEQTLKEVPDSFTGHFMDWGGMSWMQKLETKGKKKSFHDIKLFLPKWLVFEEPGDYVIVVKKNFFFARDSETYGWGHKKNTKNAHEEEISVSIKLKVLPSSRKKYGRFVTSLRDRYLKIITKKDERMNCDKFEENMTSLSCVTDRRIIAVFAKLINEKKVNYVSFSLNCLQKFTCDEALNLILKCYEYIKFEDVRKRCSNDKVAQQSLKNHKYSVACALAGSKHLNALDHLKKLRFSKNKSIRLITSQTVSKFPTFEHFLIMEKYCDDEDQMVKRESIRLIKKHPIYMARQALLHDKTLKTFFNVKIICKI